MLRVVLAVPLAILLVAGGCKAEAPPESAACAHVPQLALQGRVTDAANILSDGEESRLSQRLAGYEARMRSFVEANQEVGRLHAHSRAVPRPDAEPSPEPDMDALMALVDRALNGIELPDYDAGKSEL